MLFDSLYLQTKRKIMLTETEHRIHTYIHTSTYQYLDDWEKQDH